ncbi:MAG: ABC transporter substrate-binding protein, partial [Gammaproteobacteria bacterium]
MKAPTRLSLALAAALAVAAGQAFLAADAGAAEKLRVGKAVSEAFSFTPVEIGMRQGIYAKHGLDIESIAFAGDARMQQAAAADSIDILLGSGPAMAFIVKGAPIKAVAGMAGPPLLLAIVVRPDGPKTAADLKGKVLAVSSFGNTQAILTEKHLQHLGLKKAEYQLLAMGATGARIAALEKNLVQGSLMPPPSNVVLENQGYRLLGNTAEIIAHPIAGLGTRESNIKIQPEMIKRVLRATLRGLQFVRSNRS